MQEICATEIAAEAGDVRSCERTQSSRWKRRLGLGLIVLSCLLYGGLMLVPMFPLSAKGKVAVSSALVIFGEASFWIGGLIVGKDVIARYRSKLDLRRWFRRLAR